MPDSDAAAPEGTATHQLAKADTESSWSSLNVQDLPASQQVSWWTVREHVSPLLTAVESWPMIGTPAWCDLAPGDARKIAAVFDAAQHWALRVETCQQARCEASRDVAAAADWRAIAQEKFRLDSAVAYGTYYIPRVKS